MRFQIASGLHRNQYWNYIFSYEMLRVHMGFVCDDSAASHIYRLSVWPRCRAHCWRSAVQAGLGWSPLYREAPVEDPIQLQTISFILVAVSLCFLPGSLLCQFILEPWVSFVPEVFRVTLPKSKHLPVPNMRTHCCDTWEVSRWSCCNSTPIWRTAGLGLRPPARCCITVLFRLFSLLFRCSRIPETCCKDIGNHIYTVGPWHHFESSIAGNHSHPNVFVVQ